MKNRNPSTSERKRTNTTPNATVQATPQPGRPVDLHKNQTILDAARELLFQQGPQAVTVEAVAKKAGVSKVTVYARFNNRNNLIAHVIRSQAEIFTANLPRTPSSLAEAQESLQRFCWTVLNYLISPEHLQFMRVVGAFSPVPPDTLLEIFNQGPRNILSQLQRWLATLHDAELILCPHPAQSAEALIGMLIGLDMVRAQLGIQIENDDEDLKARAHFVVESFFRMHAAS